MLSSLFLLTSINLHSFVSSLLGTVQLTAKYQKVSKFSCFLEKLKMIELKYIMLGPWQSEKKSLSFFLFDTVDQTTLTDCIWLVCWLVGWAESIAEKRGISVQGSVGNTAAVNQHGLTRWLKGNSEVQEDQDNTIKSTEHRLLKMEKEKTLSQRNKRDQSNKCIYVIYPIVSLPIHTLPPFDMHFTGL